MPTFRQRLGKFIAGNPQGPQRVSPYKERGVSGTPIYSGFVRQVDVNPKVRGPQRYRYASEMVTNISIVAAGLRYFLNMLAKPKWKPNPANDTAEAKAIADLVEEIMGDMATGWPRIVRRNGMVKFHGFSIAEWTAKKRPDGKIGLLDIEQRPQHTIWRWGVDDSGTITGMWQRDPQTGEQLWLPRSKVLYLVDDLFTDSPEGSGWFRDLAEPFERLKRFQELETIGYERNLAGTPIGRVPYSEIEQAVEDGKITREQATAMVREMENFVDNQAKEPTTSLILDSITYENTTDGGPTFSPVAKWAIELLKGDMTGIDHLGSAIERLTFDMARVMGVQSLLTNAGSHGSKALHVSESQNLFLIVNSALGDMAEGMTKDVSDQICALNGIDESLWPELTCEDVAFKEVDQIAATLRDMALAGATLEPDDPAINDVRDLMGVERVPEDMMTRAAQASATRPSTGAEMLDQNGQPVAVRPGDQQPKPGDEGAPK